MLTCRPVIHICSAENRSVRRQFIQGKWRNERCNSGSGVDTSRKIYWNWNRRAAKRARSPRKVTLMVLWTYSLLRILKVVYKLANDKLANDLFFSLHFFLSSFPLSSFYSIPLPLSLYCLSSLFFRSTHFLILWCRERVLNSGEPMSGL